MGRALEVIAGETTAAGSTITQITINSGNSATVRNARLDTMVMLMQAWVKSQADGVARIRSPKLHDNVQGIRLDHLSGEVKPLLPRMHRQKLFPQDELILELSGSGTGGDLDLLALLIAYEDLPGQDGRFITPEQVFQNGVNTVSVENTLATGTAGDWSGEEAIDAEFDLLKANTDYALVGYLVDTECGSVRWRGSDIGNLGIGGPGDELGRDYTASWFMDIAKMFGGPWVPVFNSANKGGILLDCHQDEDGADVTVTSLLVELPPGVAPQATT